MIRPTEEKGIITYFVETEELFYANKAAVTKWVQSLDSNNETPVKIFLKWLVSMTSFEVRY